MHKGLYFFKILTFAASHSTSKAMFTIQKCLFILILLFSATESIAQNGTKPTSTNPTRAEKKMVASGFQGVIDTKIDTVTVDTVVLDSVYISNERSYKVVDTVITDTVYVKTQTVPSSLLGDTITEVSDAYTLPEFPGGDDSLKIFILSNIHLKDRHEYFETVYVEFNVDERGNTSDYKIIRGLENVHGFRRELLRVLAQMPQWKPAMLKGQPAAIRYQFSIKVRPN